MQRVSPVSGVYTATRNNALLPMRPCLHSGQCGMTVLELIIATALLSIFTAMSAVVLQYAISYLSNLSSNKVQPSGADIDPLSSQVILEAQLDYLVEVLSQPYYSPTDLSTKFGKCTLHPFGESVAEGSWKLKGKILTPPQKYLYCLTPTLSLPESPLSDLISEIDLLKPSKIAKPGIWIIKVFQVSVTGQKGALVVRRVFCRPKPFCFQG